LAGEGWSTSRALSETEYGAEAAEAYKATFRSGDPLEEPLQPWVARRGLLSSFGSTLDRHELRSLTSAIETVGEDGFFVSVTEGFSMTPVPDAMRGISGGPERRHWWVPLTLREDYYHLPSGSPFGLDYALYSRQGTWGILCSHFWIAVLGGRDQFVDALYEALGVPEQVQIQRVLHDQLTDHRKWGANIAWVPPLLAHLYGQAYTSLILREAGWPADPATWVGRYPPPAGTR
jgi:hypothetical protein